MIGTHHADAQVLQAITVKKTSARNAKEPEKMIHENKTITPPCRDGYLAFSLSDCKYDVELCAEKAPYYPLLQMMLSENATNNVLYDLSLIFHEPLSPEIKFAAELLTDILKALNAGTLPPRQSDEIVPVTPFLPRKYRNLPAGLLALIGEIAHLMLEAGRNPEAAVLYALLGSLLPSKAVGGTGLATVHMLRHDLSSAISSVIWAIESEPDDPTAQEILAAILHISGISPEHRMLLYRVVNPENPSALKPIEAAEPAKIISFNSSAGSGNVKQSECGRL